MEKTVIDQLLATLGKRMQAHRINLKLQPEDVAEMTGLTAPTIRKIESGNQTSLVNYIMICLALGVHPHEVLNIEMDIEPIFKLSDPRKEKTRLTQHIESFIQSDFFKTERTAKDVVSELELNYETKTTTSAVSVILARKVAEDVLVVLKKGKVHLYKTRKQF